MSNDQPKVATVGLENLPYEIQLLLHKFLSEEHTGRQVEVNLGVVTVIGSPGQVLRQAREKRELDIKCAARDSGVPAMVINQMEMNFGGGVDYQQFNRLCTMLGVYPETILFDRK